MADQEVIKAMKREIAYRSFMIFVAATVLITVCVAWFANNQQVQASEMTIQPSVDGFELAAQGGEGTFDNLMSEGYNKFSSKLTFTTYLGEPVEGYKTSGDNASISWAVSATSNMENVVDNSDVRLVPGSSGAMTFYIIPNGDGNLTVNLKLTLKGLIERVTIDGNTDNKSYGEPKTEDEFKMQNLLEHHLLLFAEKQGDTYSNWISPDADSWEGLELLESAEGTPSATLSYSDNTLTWTGTNLKKDVAYPVTIYWIWPEVLGQYIFADTRNNQPALFPVLGEGDNKVDYLPGLLFEKMSQTEGHSFCNDYMVWNDSLSNFTNEVTESNLESLRAGNMAMYQKISVYYNRADQYIGENVRYVRLTLDAN